MRHARIAAIAAVFLLGGVVSAPRGGEAQPGASPSIATLLVQRSAVFVNGRAAVNGASLTSGDTVATGPTGHAIITFYRGGSIELDVNSRDQIYDRSDRSFWQGVIGSSQQYLTCLTRVVFSSGQAYWEGQGQSGCFTHGAVSLVAYSEFNLTLTEGEDVLTVAEGRVSVAAEQSALVPAGTQVTIAQGRIVDRREVTTEELRQITAWRWRIQWRPYYPNLPPVRLR